MLGLFDLGGERLGGFRLSLAGDVPTISGEPAEERRDLPNPCEALIITVLVMANAIIVEKLRHSAPDLMLRPNVGIFRTLDFAQASAILRAAEPVKQEVKEKLGKLIA